MRVFKPIYKKGRGEGFCGNSLPARKDNMQYYSNRAGVLTASFLLTCENYLKIKQNVIVLDKKIYSLFVGYFMFDFLNESTNYFHSKCIIMKKVDKHRA